MIQLPDSSKTFLKQSLKTSLLGCFVFKGCDRKTQNCRWRVQEEVAFQLVSLHDRMQYQAHQCHQSTLRHLLLLLLLSKGLSARPMLYCRMMILTTILGVCWLLKENASSCVRGRYVWPYSQRKQLVYLLLITKDFLATHVKKLQISSCNLNTTCVH